MEQRLRKPVIPHAPWTIGLRLEQLLSPEVGVTGKSFSPIRRNGGVSPTVMPVREPILPDSMPPGRFAGFLGDRPHRSRRHTRRLPFTQGALAAVTSAGGRCSPRNSAPAMCCGRHCGGRPSPAESGGCKTPSPMTPRTYAFPPLTRGCGRRRRPSIRSKVLLWLTKPWYKTSATSRSQ